METISKHIGILTVLGILFGGIVIYVYLLKINQLSILPEVISNPSNLIAAITIYIPIFIIIILLYYLSLNLLSKLILFFIKLFQVKQNFRNPKFPIHIKFEEIILELFYIIILSFLIWKSSNYLKIYLEYLFPQTVNNIIESIKIINAGPYIKMLYPKPHLGSVLTSQMRRVIGR